MYPLTELERATHKIRLMHVIILPVPVLTSAGSSLLHFHQIPRLGNVITIKIHLPGEPGVLEPCLGGPSDRRGTAVCPRLQEEDTLQAPGRGAG